MKLTENQKNFILDTFFKMNTSAVGWRGIAEKLIDSGNCIVAGDIPIWMGGIGNYIKTKSSDSTF
uniref:hypothetical protein n=1 Tax=Caballeronia sp. ATUFL_F2_KS42 TaxID=2921765 RepID=UPI002029434B